jgi:hypothetical protein
MPAAPSTSGFIAPCIPTRAVKPPAGSGWVHEIKHDGNRASNAVHLAAFILWKMNWIHPFADGNGRTARAVSYVVLSIKLDSILPGTPTIPEQISTDKGPYYTALEVADAAWKATNEVDVSRLEQMLGGMLAKQLLNAAREASGESSAAPDGASGIFVLKLH